MSQIVRILPPSLKNSTKNMWVSLYNLLFDFLFSKRKCKSLLLHFLLENKKSKSRLHTTKCSSILIFVSLVNFFSFLDFLIKLY